MSSRGNADVNNSEGDPVNGTDGETGLNFGDDGENMVSGSKGMPIQGYAFEALNVKSNRDKHLRYRTRVFAAEYELSLFSAFFLLQLLSLFILHVNSFLDPAID